MKNKACVLLRAAALLLLALAAAGCRTPHDISYMQDMEAGKKVPLAEVREIKVQPDDKLSIVINSKDPLLADIFNLPIISHRVGFAQASSLSNSQQLSVYSVDKNGEIDFPVLGRLVVKDKSRSSIAREIKDRLVGERLVNDPVVTVEFANLYFSVLGEVNKPGRYSIDRDKVTLMDAIGMAGDLTIYGLRTQVLVLREVDGEQMSYKVDLTSGQDLFSSPVYYLQQKDVVYVEPNNTKLRQSTVNGNTVRSASFWISLASLLTSVAVLITK